MAEIIRMPRLSDTMEEGNIVSWVKKVGDTVKPGDVLAEVETDKATMELESYFNGTLIYIGLEKGTVPVDGIIAIIGEKNDDVKNILANAGGVVAEKIITKESPKEAELPVAVKRSEPLSVSVEEPKNISFPKDVNLEKVEHTDGDRVKASPLAKSLANHAGVDISNVQGSGDQGRIIKKDIEAFIANPVATAKPTASSISTNNSTSVAYGNMPISQMRKVIAKRLGESLFTAPHFYLTVEINMDNAIEARKAMNEDGVTKISYNDLVVKASALALRKHPMINSSWHGDKITIHEHIGIGVAVAVQDGLLVPVIQDVESKSLSTINAEIKALAIKAKDKKLQAQEMQGNTFTISNLGMFDITEFTAIINPPDACILAVGSIVEKPIVKNGQIVVGNTMKVTLSCDHRIVDGATGAQFLQSLKSLLENPIKMMA
jgi:pyruvate dehydrogenase E2 component (dihydrolipoamide acetyltransferase)